MSCTLNVPYFGGDRRERNLGSQLCDPYQRRVALGKGSVYVRRCIVYWLGRLAEKETIVVWLGLLEFDLPLALPLFLLEQLDSIYCF